MLINENREDDFEIEEDDSAEDDDAGKEEEGEEEEGGEGEEESEEEEEGGEGEGEEEEGEEEEGGKKKKPSEEDPMAKFKGKTPEQLIEMYKNLEGMIGQKALKLAQDFLAKKNVTVKKEDGKDDEFDIGLTDEELSKMSPKQFAIHLNKKITERATQIARDAIERSNETKSNVSREIQQATKAHPHLKTNKDYREIVLSIIEAGSANKKVITLKEACEKADKAMAIKPATETATVVKKKPRTQVEKQDGGDAGKVKTDRDKIIDGMMNAGGGSSTILGGL